MTLKRCQQCGKEHEEINTEIGFGKPDAYFEVPESEREKRIFFNLDVCDIDRKRFFARGVLQVPVHGHEHFGWGIWVEMRAADFIRYLELYEDPNQANEPPFHGHIATSIPAYCEPTLAIPVAIQLTGPTTRPLLFVVAGVDHLLAQDQSDGVAIDRVDGFRASIRTESSSSIQCDSHGQQERAYMCQHFSKSEKIGFFEPYAPDSEGHDPDEGLQAWCEECERVLKDEGEWTDKALQFASFRACCAGCFHEIKKLNVDDSTES
ncbi:MAG TPA: DUF2199 domain-containing protein [Candidatus Binatia bacterium]|jgi:hypothetical protein|nr:DUF2199 domain-containing protein [Candidatus Binatia bacterium]